jgi:hypothetical protein
MKSFLIIIAILVIIGAVGAVYYFHVDRALAPTTSTSTPITTGTSTTTVTTTTSIVEPGSSSYYTYVATWHTSTETATGFSIAYALDFPVVENNSTAPTTDWRLNTIDLGVRVLTITVPAAFEPKTNFSDATLTVGYSKNSQSVADCLKVDANGPPAVTSAMTINGVNFMVFTSSDAGAGNLYKTTSYRTIHAGICYAVEYTVHSGQLANFPASDGLTQYSDPMIDQVLDRVVGTFRFL